MLRKSRVNALMGVVLVALLSVMSVVWAESPLTEAEVRKFMTKLEAATRQRNYIEAAGMMSPDITMSYQVNNKPIELNRNKFLANAIAGGASYTDYQFRTQVHSVKVSNSKALVNYTVFERATSDERGTIDCVIKDVGIVERRNGKLLLTKVQGVGKMSQQRLF